MNSLLLYLLQSAAGLLLFYGFYRLVLSRERSFRFNRFYLLGTPLLALLLPLVKIPVAVPEPMADTVWVYALPAAEAPALTEAPVRDEPIASGATSPTPTPEAAGWGWPQTLLLLYLGGALFFAYRLLRQLLFVRSLLQAHREQAFAWQECTVVPTRGSAPTFSFLRYIFYNDQPPVSEAEREQILQHERVHVVQRHSLDLLYLSALQILFWFNPLFQLYQKTLTDTHEFIADEAAVQGNNLENYAQLMVRQLFRDLDRPLFHSFASSRTLSRLSMLHNPSSASTHWKKLLVLPVLILSLTLFIFQRDGGDGSATALREVVPTSPSPVVELTSTPLNPRPAHPDDEKIAYWVPKDTVRKNPADRPFLQIPGAASYADPPWDKEMAFFKGGERAFWMFLGKHIRYPYPSAVIWAGVEGMVLASFVLHPDGSLSDLKIEGSLHPILDQTVLDAIDASAGQWNPADKGGVSQPAKLILPVWFMLGPDPVQPTFTSLPKGIYLPEKRTRRLFIGPRYLGRDRNLKVEEETYKALMDYINQHVTYPPAALAAQAEGVEVIEYEVKTDGTVSDFKVLHSKHLAFAEEVIRVIKSTSGHWEAGIKDREKIAMKSRVQVRFRLEQQDAYVWKGYWF